MKAAIAKHPELAKHLTVLETARGFKLYHKQALIAQLDGDRLKLRGISIEGISAQHADWCVAKFIREIYGVQL